MKYIERFNRQAYHAKRRGIDFKLTYEDWIRIWGDKITERGRGKGKLQMCRRNDQGCYEEDNVYIDTHENNSSDKFKFGFKGRPPAFNDDAKEFVRSLLGIGYSTRGVASLVNCSQKQVMNLKNNRGASAS